MHTLSLVASTVLSSDTLRLNMPFSNELYRMHYGKRIVHRRDRLLALKKEVTILHFLELPCCHFLCRWMQVSLRRALWLSILFSSAGLPSWGESNLCNPSNAILHIHRMLSMSCAHPAGALASELPENSINDLNKQQMSELHCSSMVYADGRRDVAVSPLQHIATRVRAKVAQQTGLP